MFKYLAALALASLGPKVADCTNLERLEAHQISEGLALAQSLATVESQAKDISYDRAKRWIRERDANGNGEV